MEKQPTWRGLGVPLEACTLAELASLNEALVSRFKYLEGLRREALLQSYAVGDVVTWEWNCLIVEAKVEEITRKRLKVTFLDRTVYVDPLEVSEVRRVRPVTPLPWCGALLPLRED